MKILMVSMASMHFSRWTEQLRDAGHEIYWFDVRDTKKEMKHMDWMTHIVKWRIRYNYPYRYFIKKKMPKLYRFIQKFNDNDFAKVFERKLHELKPDLVHSFAMQISCLPILEVMYRNPTVKWAYSSWGSDVYYSKGLGMDPDEVKRCFERIDFLITDCRRDYDIAKSKGFQNKFLGVFPGNGGVDFAGISDEAVGERSVILIKAYNFGVGRGLNIVKALAQIPENYLNRFKIVIYGATQDINDFVSESERLKNADVTIHSIRKIIPNSELIALMGKSYLHVGNGISDGLPNSMIEAMGMGAFPIQSNPGNATAELIENGKNGLLIDDPENIEEIRSLILKALSEPKLFETAFKYNTNFVRTNYSRQILKPKIVDLYYSIF